MKSQVITLTAISLLVLSSSCQNNDSFPGLYPVTVTLTSKGKPVTTGALLFAPESGTWGGVTVDAPANAEGLFVARTCRVTANETIFYPGAKPGRYKITYHPPGDGSKAGTEVFLTEIVEVEAKENQLQLKLPEKIPEGKGEPRDDANPVEKP